MANVSVTHVAAQHVEANGHLRQRCAWCGAVLFDYDLSRVATPTPTPGWRPATAETGALWRVDANMGVVVEPELVPDSEMVRIPEDACFNLDPAVTA